jgi:hypothetical protein
MADWKTPPWWPAAGLRICIRDACADFIPDETGPDVCLRCGIARSEHGEERLQAVLTA